MAVFYPLAVTVTTPNWNSVLQMDGTAPAAANCVYGWTPGNLAAGYWLGGPGASARMATRGTATYLDQTTGPRLGVSATAPSDAFRTPLLNGSFAIGTWTIAMAVRATGGGTATCHIRTQLWRGPNANGSGATKIGGISVGSNVTVTGTTTTFTTSVTSSPGALTLTNEYLFLEQELRVTTPSTSGSYGLVYRQGESTITTTAFTPFTTSYTLTVDRGVFLLTGVSNTLRAARNLITQVGAVALTGIDTTLTVVRASRKLIVDVGAVALSGKAVVLGVVRKLVAAPGAVALSGKTVTLSMTRKLIAQTGAITLTGNAAALTKASVGARVLTAGYGVIALAGKSVTFIRKYVEATQVGQISLNSFGGPHTWDEGKWDEALWDQYGIPVILRVGRKVVASTGAVVVSGAATLRVGRKEAVATGAIAVSGIAPTLRIGHKAVISTGAINVTGYPATLDQVAALTLRPATGVINLTGYPVNLVRTTARAFTVTTGTIWLNSFGGRSAWDVGLWDEATWDDRDVYVTLRVGRRLVTQPGAVNVVGKPIILSTARVLRATQSSIVLTGKAANLIYAPAVTHDYVLAVAPGSILVTGRSANLRYNKLPPRYEPVSWASLQNRTVHFGIHGYRRLK